MQGSITHILGEDETGKYGLKNYYEYDAFGDFKVREESIPNRFGYTGEQYDSVADLYYLRARFYNPVIGRFIQEDTYYGDGLNLYSYCQNNPVRYVDPSGHDMCPKKQAAINELMKKGLTKEQAENYYNSLRKQGGINFGNEPTKYGSPYLQLSPKQKRDLRKKLENRTITKDEYNHEVFRCGEDRHITTNL